MMSMGNGIPMPNMRTVIFENGRGFTPSETQDTREYEILPDTPPPQDSDPDVEELPDSPMPELIPIDSDDDEEALDYEQMNVQINQLIEEIVVPEEQKEEQKEEGVVENIPQPLVAESVTELIDEPAVLSVAESAALSVAEPADEIAVGPETTVEEEEGGEVAEKLPIDFSKLDLRTLRTLVSTQGKASAEKVSKMKKNELIRILSSGSDSV